MAKAHCTDYCPGGPLNDLQRMTTHVEQVLKNVLCLIRYHVTQLLVDFLIFNIPTDTPKHFTSLWYSPNLIKEYRTTPLSSSKRPIPNSRRFVSQKYMEFLNSGRWHISRIWCFSFWQAWVQEATSTFDPRRSSNSTGHASSVMATLSYTQWQ